MKRVLEVGLIKNYYATKVIIIISWDANTIDYQMKKQ